MIIVKHIFFKKRMWVHLKIQQECKRVKKTEKLSLSMIRRFKNAIRLIVIFVTREFGRFSLKCRGKSDARILERCAHFCNIPEKF